jgi:hypothetical protein
MRALQSPFRLKDDTHCDPCVYCSTNLDGTEYPVLMNRERQCGLGFIPGDSGCTDMRTDNCSARKIKEANT